MANKTKKNSAKAGKVQVAKKASGKAVKKATNPKAAEKFATSKKEATKQEVYKDAYSKKEWPSELAFYEMKKSHANSNFSKLDAKLLEVVNKKQKTAKIDVLALGIPNHIDWRLPKYNLKFIGNLVNPLAHEYRITPNKVGEKKSHLVEFTMELKEVAKK